MKDDYFGFESNLVEIINIRPGNRGGNMKRKNITASLILLLFASILKSRETFNNFTLEPAKHIEKLAGLNIVQLFVKE